MHSALPNANMRHVALWQVDATLEDVDRHRARLLSLLYPAHTVMDLNIGAALWLAAQGTGRVRLMPASPHAAARNIPGASCASDCAVPALGHRVCSTLLHDTLMRLHAHTTIRCNAGGGNLLLAATLVGISVHQCQLRWVAACADAQASGASSYWAGGIYRSAARIVLVGHGADEQNAAYGRHRSRFRTHVRRRQRPSSRAPSLSLLNLGVCRHEHARTSVPQVIITWHANQAAPTLASCMCRMKLEKQCVLVATQRWEGLAAELALDMARLWRRNLGRDDRLLADTGREV